MADVFISYARADIDVAKTLAVDLEAHGYTVWWDYQINAGQNFRTTIFKALNAAKAVIVVWSKDSAESHWVTEEASLALKARKLVAVRLPELADIPFGFAQLHTDYITDRSRIYRALDGLGCTKASPPTAQKSTHDIFISHVEQDKAHAQALAQNLKSHGFNVWRDANLYTGRDYYDVVGKAVGTSKAVIVIWSDDALKSQLVRGEATRAGTTQTLIHTFVPSFNPHLVPLGIGKRQGFNVTFTQGILQSLSALGVNSSAPSPTPQTEAATRLFASQLPRLAYTYQRHTKMLENLRNALTTGNKVNAMVYLRMMLQDDAFALDDIQLFNEIKDYLASSDT